MNLAVIPARGGSKRIPRKNIRPFAGRPMMSWSIRAAQDAGCFDRIIVSTDDDAIADAAKAAGAEVPFKRPPELSDDHTETRPVIAHAIEEMRMAGFDATNVCCIYATAAFTTGADIAKGHETLCRTGASYVFPVLPFPAPIERSLRLSTDGHIQMVMPEHFATRSQDLQPAWHDAGQFYWAEAETWLTDAPVFRPDAVGLRLEPGAAFDIDTEEDWAQAEAIFQMRREQR